MTRKQYYLGMRYALLFAVILGGCNNNQESKYANSAYQALLSNDTLNLIENVTNVQALLETVCDIGCKEDQGYTGKYALKYSLKNKSFINLSNDSNVISLPLVGYKCPNSFIDHFYSELEFELQKGLIDSIPYKVRDHIAYSHYNDTYPPIIEIVVNRSTEVEELAESMYQVILGYIQIYDEIAETNCGKEINSLTADEIDKVRKMEPINIRITPEDRNLYCK